MWGCTQMTGVLCVDVAEGLCQVTNIGALLLVSEEMSFKQWTLWIHGGGGCSVSGQLVLSVSWTRLQSKSDNIMQS